jgi:hypothetical protein
MLTFGLQITYQKLCKKLFFCITALLGTPKGRLFSTAKARFFGTYTSDSQLYLFLDLSFF